MAKIIAFNAEMKSVTPKPDITRQTVFTTDTVIVQFTIADMLEAELATASPTLKLWMGDGSYFEPLANEVVRTGLVYTYPLKANEGDHTGFAHAQLVLTLPGPTELTSQKFEYKIEQGLDGKVPIEVLIAYWTALTQSALPAGVKTLSELSNLLKGAVEGVELITNGSNFVNTTGWTTFNATQAIVDGNLVITGTGAVYSGSNFYIGAADPTGTKYYYRYRMRTRTAGATKIGIRSSATAVTNTEIANPVTDQWYTKHGGFTKTAAQGSTTNVSPAQYAGNTIGMVIEVSELNAINLTAIYGAGLEPEPEDFGYLFDSWLATFLAATSAAANATPSGVISFEETIANIKNAIEGTNMITNGGPFENTGGWTPFQATQAIVNGLLVLTGSVAATYSGSNFYVGAGAPTGSKFFYRYKARVRSAGCTRITVRSSSTYVTSMDTLNPTVDVWYTKSGGFTKTAAVDATTNVYPCQLYATTDEMIGKVLEIEKVIAIDLTALYGAGNEPTYDEFSIIYDNWLSAYLRDEKTRLDSLVVTTPDYTDVQTEVMNKQTPQSLDYVMITDIHLIDSVYEVAIERLRKAVDIANMQFVDMLVVGGDLICTSGYSEPIATSRLKMLAVRDILKDSRVPVIVMHGNHDDNSTNQFPHTLAEHYSQEDFYKTLIRPFEIGQNYIHDSQKPASTYFYKDFPTKKMRLIVLDGCDYPVILDAGNLRYRGADWFGYGARQTTWFGTEALVGIPAGYKVVVLTHTPMESIIKNSSLIQGQLTACNNGTSYSGTNAEADYGVSVSVNFAAQGARKVLLVHHGHNHNDATSLRDSVYNAVCTYWSGSATLEALDITTVDGEANKLWFTRVGTTGVDREIQL